MANIFSMNIIWPNPSKIVKITDTKYELDVIYSCKKWPKSLMS